MRGLHGLREEKGEEGERRGRVRGELRERRRKFSKKNLFLDCIFCFVF